jgi:hypothetical protein
MYFICSSRRGWPNTRKNIRWSKLLLYGIAGGATFLVVLTTPGILNILNPIARRAPILMEFDDSPLGPFGCTERISRKDVRGFQRPFDVPQYFSERPTTFPASRASYERQIAMYLARGLTEHLYQRSVGSLAGSTTLQSSIRSQDR